MLNITWRNKKSAEWIRKQTRVRDVQKKHQQAKMAAVHGLWLECKITGGP